MFRLATRLHSTVAELERRLTRVEFLEWLAYEDIELARHEKQDYYLAQIAQCVIAPHLKAGADRKLSDYLIKFGEAEKKGNGLSKLDPNAAANLLKTWFGGTIGEV